MQLHNVFRIHQGHQITDFEIYSTEGNIPVYTGDNELKGYWNKSIIEKSHLPCLTYPTKAFAGNIFIQEKIFDANNTAVLILKEAWKGKLRLEWFKYHLPRYFQEAMTSKEGVSYLNKSIVEDIEIEIPDIKQQNIEIEYFFKLEKNKHKLHQILKKYDNLFLKNLIINNNKSDQVLLSDIFDYTSRNDGLSEEGIYNNNPINKKGGVIKVLSGGTDDIEYGEITINTPNIHFIKNKQALHLVTRGKAGRLTYMPKGIYATNTNAFLLYLKEEKLNELRISNEKDEEIYLKFMKFYLEPKFIELASFSDVAVFPLTEVMKDMSIPKFRLNQTIKNIVKKLDDILNGYNFLKCIYDKVEDLQGKNIQR